MKLLLQFILTKEGDTCAFGNTIEQGCCIAKSAKKGNAKDARSLCPLRELGALCDTFKKSHSHSAVERSVATAAS